MADDNLHLIVIMTCTCFISVVFPVPCACTVLTIVVCAWLFTIAESQVFWCGNWASACTGVEKGCPDGIPDLVKSDILVGFQVVGDNYGITA